MTIFHRKLMWYFPSVVLWSLSNDFELEKNWTSHETKIVFMIYLRSWKWKVDCENVLAWIQYDLIFSVNKNYTRISIQITLWRKQPSMMHFHRIDFKLISVFFFLLIWISKSFMQATKTAYSNSIYLDRILGTHTRTFYWFNKILKINIDISSSSSYLYRSFDLFLVWQIFKAYAN